MNYSAPIKDMQFVLHELAGLKQIQTLPGCEDATDETVAAVLEEGEEPHDHVVRGGVGTLEDEQPDEEEQRRPLDVAPCCGRKTTSCG